MKSFNITFISYGIALWMAILFLIVGCSGSNPKNEVPEYVARLDNVTIYQANQNVDTLYLEQEQVFGTQQDVVTGRIGNIAVDKEGRLFIADQEKHTIHLFQANGYYITHIGREGKGPGEFGSMGGLKIKLGKLAVYDVLNQRISFFSLNSLSLIHEINIPAKDSMFGLGQFYFIDDDTLLIGFNDMGRPGNKRYTHFYAFDEQEGKLLDKVLKLRIKSIFKIHANGHTMAGTKPLSRTTLIGVSNSSQIYTAWTDHFLIKVYDARGNYLKSFYYPFQNRAVDVDKYINQFPEGQRGVIKEIELPDSYPALSSMLIDDRNRLWISTTTSNQDTYRWWVLDGSNGHLLARFTWPQDKPIVAVKNGKVYTKEQEENGVQHIVRYDISIK